MRLSQPCSRLLPAGWVRESNACDCLRQARARRSVCRVVRYVRGKHGLVVSASAREVTGERRAKRQARKRAQRNVATMRVARARATRWERHPCTRGKRRAAREHRVQEARGVDRHRQAVRHAPVTAGMHVGVLNWTKSDHDHSLPLEIAYSTVPLNPRGRQCERSHGALTSDLSLQWSPFRA